MSDGAVLGLVGSLRATSFTEAAVDRVLAAVAARGLPVKRLDREYLALPLCDGRAGSSLPDSVIALKMEVSQARAIVLGSPVYNGFFSAVIKNALEWIGPEEISGRIIGVVAVAEGSSAIGAASALQALCIGMGAWVVPVTATVPLAELVFKQPDAPFSAEIFRGLDALGEALSEACHRLGFGVAE